MVRRQCRPAQTTIAGKSTIVNPNHLLDAADHLVSERRPGAPRQANLRRAVSSVYYALFHWLAQCAADSLVGVAETAGDSWTRVYRALNHRDLRQRCRKGCIPLSTPQTEVLAHVEDARGILADLQGAAPSAKRAFAVHVLFRERRD